MSAPTFPPHPRAGFSAVTYLFLDSETGMANRDSLGTRKLIEPGGLHWTAAGRGVVHEEVPALTGSTTHLLQIFVNLPAQGQNAEPFALSLAPQDVPVAQRPGARIRVPRGSFGGVHSPLTPPTEVSLLDITLEAGAALEIAVAADQRAFVMPVNGSAELEGVGFGVDDLGAPILPVADRALTHKLYAPGGSAKVAVFIGEPLRQPIFSNGPMAFATQQNLIMAGVTTDVCLISPAIDAAVEGFNVQAVMDASGSPSLLSEEFSRQRMHDAGVVLTATNTLMAEIAQDWSTLLGSS